MCYVRRWRTTLSSTAIWQARAGKIIIKTSTERQAMIVGDSARHYIVFFFFSSRRRHTRLQGDWSSDVCSSDLNVMIWLGSGPFPEPLPARAGCFTLLTGVEGLQYWNDAVARWKAEHPAMTVNQIGRASCRERV